MKIYYCTEIKDYCFEDLFKTDYHDYDQYYKNTVWFMADSGNFWCASYKSKTMEYVVKIKE